jgi:hypothetical protein
MNLALPWFGRRNKRNGWVVPAGSMRHQTVAMGANNRIDWKALGYLISIASVFFLGALAWPKPTDPRWHVAVLILGMAASIMGMGCRYKAHLDQQQQMKRTEAEARRR